MGIVIKPSTSGGTSSTTWEPQCHALLLLKGVGSSRSANIPLPPIQSILYQQPKLSFQHLNQIPPLLCSNPPMIFISMKESLTYKPYVSTCQLVCNCPEVVVWKFSGVFFCFCNDWGPPLATERKITWDLCVLQCVDAPHTRKALPYVVHFFWMTYWKASCWCLDLGSILFFHITTVSVWFKTS